MKDAATQPPPQNKKLPIGKEIQDFLRLMGDFDTLLVQETKALKEANFESADALRDPKKEIARRYHEHVQILAGRKDEIASLDLAAKENFIRSRTRFTMTLNDNMRAIEAVKSSTQRLIERIRSTAAKSVIDERQTHYSAKGQTASWKTATMSLSIDTQL